MVKITPENTKRALRNSRVYKTTVLVSISNRVFIVGYCC